MPDKRSKSSRFIGLFLFGWFIFSYPVLTLFNHEDRLFGIPLFLFYLFFAWMLLIVLTIAGGKKT